MWLNKLLRFALRSLCSETKNSHKTAQILPMKVAQNIKTMKHKKSMVNWSLIGQIFPFYTTDKLFYDIKLLCRVTHKMPSVEMSIAKKLRNGFQWCFTVLCLSVFVFLLHVHINVSRSWTFYGNKLIIRRIIQWKNKNWMFFSDMTQVQMTTFSKYLCRIFWKGVSVRILARTKVFLVIMPPPP